MGIEKRSFHYMRYVMAILGGAAFGLLSFHQYLESVSEGRYHNHYGTIPHNTEHIIYAARVVLLIFTGIFSKRLSAKWTMAVVMSIHALHAVLCNPLYYHGFFVPLTILTNVASVMSPTICFVAMHAMISKWSPPNERSLMISIVYSGIAAATACFVTAAFRDADYNARYIAIFSIVWIILWCIMMGDSPEQQKKFILRIEKDCIRSSIEAYWPRPSPNKGTTLKKIIVSEAFVSVVLVEISNVFIQTILMHLLPISTKASPLRQPGEYIGQTIFILICGIVTAVCLHRRIISFDLARKMPSIIAIIIPLPLIIFSFAQRGHRVRQVCTIISHTVIGAKYSGTLANIIDISPDDAPYLMTIVSIISQVFMAVSYELIDSVHNNFKQYEDIIVITPITTFVIVSAVLYWFWGSTAQKKAVSICSDPTAGKIYSHQPAQPRLQEPVY